jgi:phenylacetate-CoA ligase
MNWRRPVLRSLLRIHKPQVLRELELIESIERKSPEAVRAVQEERLGHLLHHAWRHTEYYREVLEACGAVRSGRVNLDRFADIPFLTKDIIRTQRDRLRACELPRGRKAYWNRSGGSTGAPLEFYQDSGYWASTIANRTYHFSLAGKQLGERELKVWGHEGDLYSGTLGWRSVAENWLYNRRFQQCWHLPEERIRRIIAEINDWRPKLMWCYRDGIDGVARYVNRHHLAVHSPQAIILGGATVHDFIAQTISRAFKAPVLSAYGSREIGAAACQCLLGQGHHIAAQSHVIEAVDDDGMAVFDRDAELVVTPLQNYAMPFIRYRIGDRGILSRGRCACGRSFPLLDAITGRVVEVIYNARGDQIDPIFFIWIMSEKLDRPRMRKAQIVQEEDGSITLNLVLDSGAATQEVMGDLTDVAPRIKAVMGSDCEVRIAFVDEIPLTSSGKHPYIVSRKAEAAANYARAS